MPTLQQLIDEYIRAPLGGAVVRVGIFQAVSRAVVPEDAGIIFAARGPLGRTVAVAESPFVNDGLGNRSPNGVRYYVASAELEDDESTFRYLLYVASHLHTLVQVSANASAWQLQLRLMSTDGTGIVRFRQLLYEPEISHPINARLTNIEATQALWGARWTRADDRVSRAAVQYQLALQREEQNESLMAVAHLYMGVEAITRAVIDLERSKRGVSEQGLGEQLGLDPATERFGAKLQTEIRRQLIFKGDLKTYNAARALSDGIEHGFATWDDLWATPGDVMPKTAQYLREAILATSGVSDAIRDQLCGSPFDSHVERGPRIAFESQADVRSVDLRQNDFAIADLRRQMTASKFDRDRGEYQYEYTLSPRDGPIS
jgi:hypothetical protein